MTWNRVESTRGTGRVETSTQPRYTVSDNKTTQCTALMDNWTKRTKSPPSLFSARCSFICQSSKSRWCSVNGSTVCYVHYQNEINTTNVHRTTRGSKTLRYISVKELTIASQTLEEDHVMVTKLDYPVPEIRVHNVVVKDRLRLLKTNSTRLDRGASIFGCVHFTGTLSSLSCPTS